MLETWFYVSLFIEFYCKIYSKTMIVSQPEVNNVLYHKE